MPGPGIVPRTGVYYLESVSQVTPSTYTLRGKYEDYTGFSTPADVDTGWKIYPQVYWNAYPIAGLYACYIVTDATVLTGGANNLQLSVSWDTAQNDTADAYYPIAGISCVLTDVTPQFKLAIPTPYRDASANGVRLAYDAYAGILNLDRRTIIDTNYGATGPTGPQGLGAYSVGT